MAIEDCSPPYEYRPPAWVPNVQQTAPGYTETRGRIFNVTMYRTKLPGTTQNQIQIQLIDNVATPTLPPPVTWILNVYNITGALAETYTVTVVDTIIPATPPIPNPTPPPPTLPGTPAQCVPAVAPALRALVNAGSTLIEMPTVDHGGTVSSTPIFIAGNAPAFNTPPGNPPGDGCVSAFGPANVSGATGPPIDLPSITSISTGPERTLSIIQLSEIVTGTAADNGRLIDPPIKGRQFDGTDWIQYVANSDCVCT